MSFLSGIMLLAASFFITATVFAVWQTWVRLNAPAPSADTNFKRCAWVAFVIGVWWAHTAWVGWGKQMPMFTSLVDQRIFLLCGVTPTLFIVGLTSTVHPWAHSIRAWLLGANLVAVGWYYGLFVGTVSWTENAMIFGWLFGPALGFGGCFWYVLRSRPGQMWEGRAPLSASSKSTHENGIGT